MFALETQLHGTVNGVIFGPAKQFATAGFFPQQDYCLLFGMSSKTSFFFQNILKRTTPGSRDEDTATKAFNELKKVVIIIPTVIASWLSTSIITGEAQQ